MQQIKIRLIEEHVLARLKSEAKKQGIGLETHARNILIDHALHPEIRKVEDRYAQIIKDMTALYAAALSESTETLQRNNDLLENIYAFLNAGGRRK